MSQQVTQIIGDVRSQSLNAVVAGFGFASALAWLDFIRWLISVLVKVKANGGNFYLISALLTTLISVIAVMLITRFGGTEIKKTSPVVYAVTR